MVGKFSTPRDITWISGSGTSGRTSMPGVVLMTFSDASNGTRDDTPRDDDRGCLTAPVRSDRRRVSMDDIIGAAFRGMTAPVRSDRRRVSMDDIIGAAFRGMTATRGNRTCDADIEVYGWKCGMECETKFNDAASPEFLNRGIRGPIFRSKKSHSRGDGYLLRNKRILLRMHYFVLTLPLARLCADHLVDANDLLRRLRRA